MTKVEYQTQINASVQKVYEYYTDPKNIQEAWPQDIIKESEGVSGSKNEEGSEMRVKGQYMGKEEEMKLQVVDKEENRRLVTKQTQGHLRNGIVYRNFNHLEQILHM
jgi:uncharacterized protein YndB with AHSA1/START domain